MGYHTSGSRSRSSGGSSSGYSRGPNAARRRQRNLTKNPNVASRAVKNRMNTVKTNRGGKLNISSRSRKVDPPQGFHWMLENGRYYLMEGDYQPHPGAVKQAEFKLASHGKG